MHTFQLKEMEVQSAVYFSIYIYVIPTLKQCNSNMIKQNVSEHQWKVSCMTSFPWIQGAHDILVMKS